MRTTYQDALFLFFDDKRARFFDCSPESVEQMRVRRGRMRFTDPPVDGTADSNADDDHDPFGAGDEYVSLFHDNNGREWKDVTYEEAKALAARARAANPTAPPRSDFPEPTEGRPTESADADLMDTDS